MPLVSLWLSTSILAILPPSIVTLTFTSPPMSLTPVPMYSLSPSATSFLRLFRWSFLKAEVDVQSNSTAFAAVSPVSRQRAKRPGSLIS